MKKEGNRMFENYLLETDIINYNNEAIKELIQEFREYSYDSMEYVKRAYEYVRDEIKNSADINNSKKVTCKASDVLRYKEGVNFAKCNLLAALLRGNRIPAGFAYQRVILDDEKRPYLGLHGLNTVYIKKIDRWIRLDARGNKEGINAQFSIDNEMLAFNIREEFGEENLNGNYDTPIIDVVSTLIKCKTVDELWDKMPRG